MQCLCAVMLHIMTGFTHRFTLDLQSQKQSTFAPVYLNACEVLCAPVTHLPLNYLSGGIYHSWPFNMLENYLRMIWKCNSCSRDASRCGNECTAIRKQCLKRRNWRHHILHKTFHEATVTVWRCMWIPTRQAAFKARCLRQTLSRRRGNWRPGSLESERSFLSVGAYVGHCKEKRYHKVDQELNSNPVLTRRS